MILQTHVHESVVAEIKDDSSVGHPSVCPGEATCGAALGLELAVARSEMAAAQAESKAARALADELAYQLGDERQAARSLQKIIELQRFRILQLERHVAYGTAGSA